MFGGGGGGGGSVDRDSGSGDSAVELRHLVTSAAVDLSTEMFVESFQEQSTETVAVASLQWS